MICIFNNKINCWFLWKNMQSFWWKTSLKYMIMIKKVTREFFLWFLKFYCHKYKIWSVKFVHDVGKCDKGQICIFLFEHNFVEMNELHWNVRNNQGSFMMGLDCEGHTIIIFLMKESGFQFGVTTSKRIFSTFIRHITFSIHAYKKSLKTKSVRL
jgi:hypothetical protein